MQRAPAGDPSRHGSTNIPHSVSKGTPSTSRQRRPVILTFVRCYLPGYKAGGPLRTISNMVEALGDDLDFRIVTSDRDATDTEPYPGIAHGEWKRVGKARVLYLSPRRKGLRQIADILCGTPHDILYLNSFFDPDFTLKPLLARRLGLAPKTRCIIAPRGEFSQSALRLKAVKKNMFFFAAGMIGLYKNLEWHASSKYERADIRRVQRRTARHIKIAINLSDMTTREPPAFTPRHDGEPLRICFLSRISPMKNLHYAIDVLRKIQVPVQFDIYGPIRDDAYWSYCKERIAQLPGSIQARYRGGLEHDKVASVIAGYDLFFLPSLGENYGHSILEALAAGTPVLIADTTPWRKLGDMGVGWDLPLDKPAAFVECIHTLARLKRLDLAEMKARASAFARRQKLSRKAVEENRRLFS